MPISETTLLAALKAAAKWALSKTSKKLRIARAERMAYHTGNRGNESEITRSFEETYDRLLGSLSSPGVVSPLTAAARYISAPVWLQAPSTKEWLALSGTKSALFHIAKASVSHTLEDPNVRRRLAETYAEATGEAAALADGTINSIVDALVAGYGARLKEQSKLIVDTVIEQGEATRTHVSGELSQVTESLAAMTQVLQSPSQRSEHLATTEATKQCELLLKVRNFDVTTPGKMRTLAKRVRTGDLADASQAIKERIYIWTARLLSGNEASLPEAEHYLALVSANQERPEVLVARALIAERKGKFDDALQMLRDIDTPDSRAVLLWVLKRAGKNERAIEWYESQRPPLRFEALTAMGWMALAEAYKNAGKWDTAIHCLETARPLAADFPDLLYVEGMHRAAMVVPVEQRSIVLEANLIYGNVTATEGRTADDWRATAIDILQRAQAALLPLNTLRAEFASWCRLWLALGSRDDSTRNAARREVQEGVADLAEAVKLYPIARQYEIAVDQEALAAHLAMRRSIGGLSDSEWIAQFFLALDTKEPAEILRFLDEFEDKIKEVVNPKALTHIRIQALLKSEGQVARAQAVLEANRAVYDEVEFGRIEAEIAAAQGTDVRPQLEALYRKAQNLTTLNALVEYLKRVEDIAALEPLARRLYELDRTAAHARTIAACLRRRPDSRPSALVQFLESEVDVVGDDDELQSELAWAYFECGNWRKAKVVNDRQLARQPKVERHIGLDINLAVQSGEWDRFAVIFEREWPHRDSLSSQILLMLVNLAAEGQAQPDKAFELVKLAAEKADGDSRILVAAYNAAVTIGKETELSEGWLESAADADTSGVTRRLTMREIVENVMPSMRKRADAAVEALAKSSVPMQVAARLLNVPMAQLYCLLPLGNEAEADARKRAVLPFFAARTDEPVVLRDWSIGLDVSAIVTLTLLNALPSILSTFKAVFIPQDALVRLLNEKQRVRFQQPSEVRLAQDMLASMERLPILPAGSGHPPPPWLEAEVGTELALLLQRAKESNSFVVAAHPILRMSSMGEETANLREYADRVLTVRTFVAALVAGGKLARAVAERADTMLARFERGQITSPPDDSLRQPVYIDALAMRFLQQAGVLGTASLSPLELRTSPNAQADFQRTIDESKSRERTVEIIDAARRHVADGLASGKIQLLGERQRANQQEAADTMAFAETLTLHAFLQSCREIDALVVDDRYITRTPFVADADGRAVPALSSLDLIGALARFGACDEGALTYYRHRLRMMGAALVSITEDELWVLLKACQIGSAGELQETAELRTLRQMTIQSCNLQLADPRDRMFFESISRAVDGVLVRLWASDDVAVDRAQAATTWLFEGLIRPLWTAAVDASEPSQQLGKALVGMTIGSWLTRAAFWSEQRREAFHAVVSALVVEPALRANRDFVDAIASHVANLFLSLRHSNSRDRDTDAWILLLASRMPTAIQDSIFESKALDDVSQAQRVSTIQFSAATALTAPELYAAAKMAVKHGEYAYEASARYRFAADHASVTMEVEIDGQWKSVHMPELGGLLLGTEQRRACLELALKEIGPTCGEADHILHAIEHRALNVDELASLLSARVHGVRGYWERIHAGRVREPQLDVIAPSDGEYYVQLLGTLPATTDAASYLTECVVPYWKSLLQRDLSQGLQIGLAGFLHPLLAPSQLVESRSNDEVWNAIVAIQPVQDPFSLVGMAEIALQRLEDRRFQQLFVDCINRVCGDGDDERRMYSAAALFARLALNGLQMAESSVAIEPFWKRVAAWMQGGIILHEYRDRLINVEALSQWVESVIPMEFAFAEVFDTYKEPLVSSSWMTSDACRDNALRLLKWVTDSAKESGADIPTVEVLDKAIHDRQVERSAFLALPGPAGHTNAVSLVEPTDEQRQSIDAEFEKDALSQRWNALCMVCQIGLLPKSVYARGVEHLRTFSLEQTDVEWPDRMMRAADASLVAIANRDGELADTLRDFLLRSAPQATSAERVGALLHALFLSAGAYEDDKREEWILDTLKRASLAFPPGQPSATAASMFSSFAEFSAWKAGPAMWAELHARTAS